MHGIWTHDQLVCQSIRLSIFCIFSNLFTRANYKCSLYIAQRRVWVYLCFNNKTSTSACVVRIIQLLSNSSCTFCFYTVFLLAQCQVWLSSININIRTHSIVCVHWKWKKKVDEYEQNVYISFALRTCIVGHRRTSHRNDSNMILFVKNISTNASYLSHFQNEKYLHVLQQSLARPVYDAAYPWQLEQTVHSVWHDHVRSLPDAYDRIVDVVVALDANLKNIIKLINRIHLNQSTVFFRTHTADGIAMTFIWFIAIIRFHCCSKNEFDKRLANESNRKLVYVFVIGHNWQRLF